ncbi:MAG: TetR/AcrR family transcriptional regulator [Solirubrobacteraceae bacterium]
MAAPTRTPRGTWIDAGLRALAAGGPDAVRIESLAQELGVTRGGFYWHFEDRGMLLHEMLDVWERRSIEEVIERVEQEGGDPRKKVLRAGKLTFSHTLLAIDLAVRDWSRRDASVAARLRRVDNRRIAYLRSLFASFCDDQEEVEARCLLAFSLVIGGHFIAADHGPVPRAEVMERATRLLLA